MLFSSYYFERRCCSLGRGNLRKIIPTVRGEEGEAEEGRRWRESKAESDGGGGASFRLGTGGRLLSVPTYTRCLSGWKLIALKYYLALGCADSSVLIPS